MDMPTEQETSAPDPIRATIATIAELHERSEREVDPHQRGIERITVFLGRPAFLYTCMAFVLLWIVINLSLKTSGHAPFDVPPFYWLQGMVSVLALFTTTTVLIKQRRQDRVAERREQLDLQISMLIEQETTKIIALLEELRHDLPIVPDRRDLEAERLASATDTAEIVSEIDRVLDEMEETLVAEPPVQDQGEASSGASPPE